MNIKTVPVALVCATLLLGACSNGDNIAEVNGRGITQQEFSTYLQFKRIPQQNQESVDRVLDDYLQREALAEAIVDSGYIDEAMLSTELREFRKQMLLSRYFEKYLEDVVNDEAIRNYYNLNKEEFQREQVKVAHILIRTNEKMSAQERQALLTKAQEAYSKARTGADFAALAEQYSEDSVSAKRGGEIGWIERGSIDPVFSERAFNTAAGQVSEPFATPFGFHVIKVLEAPQIVEAAFEKVEGNIRYRLRQEAKEAETARLLGSVKVNRP